MKMQKTTFGFRMEAKDDHDELEIFDDIGNHEDADSWWPEFGAKRASEAIKKCKSKSLTVRINSKGGDLFTGLAVYNILKDSGKDLTVRIDGLAASAASVIAMAGAKIVMPKASMMMVHNCWCYAMGNSKELRKVADNMDKAMLVASVAYLDKAGDKLTAEKLAELLDDESYLTAEDCLALGLCDEVVGLEAEEPEEEPEEQDAPDEEEKKDDAPKNEPVIDIQMQKKTLWDFWN